MSNNKFGFRTRTGLIKDIPVGLSVYDADAQAFINTAGITDVTQQDAISKLVQDFKSYGIWTKMSAVYPFVGGTATTHSYNLKNPALYQITWSGGVTHNSTGITGNALNAFGNTGVPGTVTPQTSHHISVYSRSSQDGNNADIANNTNIPSYGSALQVSSFNNSILYNNGVSVSTPANGSIGFFLNNRISGTQLMSQKNNLQVLFNSVPSTWAGFIYKILRFGDFTNSNNYSNKNLSFCTIGEGLTSTEAYNFYVAIQTFQARLNRDVGGKFVSDPDAQAFVFSAAIDNQTQANAVNTLVTSLKSAGLWNKFKAIYPFVGGNATAHKFNLKDPRDVDAAYRLVFSGGWTHSATGALPNGTNAFADTKLAPDTTLSQFSTTMTYYSRTNSNASYVEMGSKSSNSQKLNFAIKLSGTGYYDQNDETNGRLTVNMSSTTSTGYYVMSRTANNVQKAFRNGIQLGSTNTNTITSALPSFISYIGATNDVGGITYTNRECAFATIGDGLSDSEITTLYNIIQTFQTTLGRQV